MNEALHGAAAGLGHMNPLDWGIALVLAVSTVMAFLRGLIRSVVSLAGILAGVLLAFWYCHRLAGWLHRWITESSLAEVASFVLILVGVIVLAALLCRLLRGACSAVGLGFLDRLGGACFGFARGILLLAALLLPVAPFLRSVPAAQTSLLLPYLLPAAHGISFVVPRDFGRRLSSTDWLTHARTAAGEWTPSIVRTMPSERGKYE
jgi:membrane protein required for colicin V production